MHHVLATAPLTAYEHMALDETLVRLYRGQAFLRFYRWTPGPAITFGYAQFISEVRRAALSGSGPLVRRPTGGGMVRHQDDLTFSLVFTSQDRPQEIYRALHAQIERALGSAVHRLTQPQPPSAYAPSQQHEASMCFVRPVENDLLAADGHKILGGALRRFGTTVLYQGSLQLPGARENAALKRAVLDGVQAFLQVGFTPQRCAADVLESARMLARTQYETAAWTEKF